MAPNLKPIRLDDSSSVEKYLLIDSRTGQKYLPVFVEHDGQKGMLRCARRPTEPVLESEEAQRGELEKFLDWLLDPEWFLETDTKNNKERDAHVKRVKRIQTRLEAEAREWPCRELNHAVADLKNRVESIRRVRGYRNKFQATNAKVPHDSERILGAALILKRLDPGAYPYREIQKRLEAKGGARHIRAWENRVARLRKTFHGETARAELAILERMYMFFLHVNGKYHGFSVSQQKMLESLVTGEHQRSARKRSIHAE